MLNRVCVARAKQILEVPGHHARTLLENRQQTRKLLRLSRKLRRGARQQDYSANSDRSPSVVLQDPNASKSLVHIGVSRFHPDRICSELDGPRLLNQRSLFVFLAVHFIGRDDYCRGHLVILFEIQQSHTLRIPSR